MKLRRRHEPAIEKISKHELAGSIAHIQGIFFNIKKISNSGEIDRLCVDGISKLVSLSGAAELQQQLDEIRERQIVDPMM